jgi:hypothetical protein
MSEGVAYLVQGARANLLTLRFPEGAPVYRLCYDDPLPIPGAGFIYDNACSWAGGRNRLLELARANPEHEYLVFCDDDCVLTRGSFEEFAATLLAARPAVATPVMPKGRLFGPLHNRSIQAAVVLDEQMVAIHKSLVGIPGLAPLVTAYDDVSWYASSLIFEHQALAMFGRRVQQFNKIEIANDGHAWMEPGAKYRQGEWRNYWPLVHRWLRNNGVYDYRIIEPYYPIFGTDALRKATLSKAARLRHRRALHPVNINSKPIPSQYLKRLPQGELGQT